MDDDLEAKKKQRKEENNPICHFYFATLKFYLLCTLRHKTDFDVGFVYRKICLLSFLLKMPIYSGLLRQFDNKLKHHIL